MDEAACTIGGRIRSGKGPPLNVDQKVKMLTHVCVEDPGFDCASMLHLDEDSVGSA
jgi:hypothetical protein